MILSVEISITPERTERITVRENEDVAEIAKVFCATHDLDKSMQKTLLSQLDEHVENYHRTRNEERLIASSVRVSSKKKRAQTAPRQRSKWNKKPAESNFDKKVSDLLKTSLTKAQEEEKDF